MSFRVRPIRKRAEPRVEWKKVSATMATGLMLAANLYAATRARLPKHSAEDGKRSLGKRFAAIAWSGLFVLLIVGLLVRGLVALRIISLTNFLSLTGERPPMDDQGRTNILLLGVGDRDHDGADLTDTMMLVSIDAKHTKSIALLSIPRDIYIQKTLEMGEGKINGLYVNYKDALIRRGQKESASRDSLAQLGRELGTLFDLPIHHVVKINFSGFEHIIDLIGGIDVFVDEDIIDREYPGPNYAFETFEISRGPHHLDGKTALKYARSRHTSSDFSRSARQQQIIAAAGYKLKKLGLLKNIARLSEMYSIVAANVESTMTTRQLIGLAAVAKGLDASHVVSMQLSDQNGIDGLSGPGGFLYTPPREFFSGASVLLPVSIPPTPITWKQIHTFSNVLFGHRELLLKPIPAIAILNAGAPEGSARKLGSELYRYGFNVVEVENIYKQAAAISTSTIIQLSPSTGPTSPPPSPPAEADTIAFLGRLFGLKSSHLPANLSLKKSADIAIVVGADFTYRPLSELLAVDQSSESTSQ